jgi:hypothetical protein
MAVYGPKQSQGPYNILGMTDRSINCHSAMNCLLYYTQRTKTTSVRTQLNAMSVDFWVLYYIVLACLQRQIV